MGPQFQPTGEDRSHTGVLSRTSTCLLQANCTYKQISSPAKRSRPCVLSLTNCSLPKISTWPTIFELVGDELSFSPWLVKPNQGETKDPHSYFWFTPLTNGFSEDWKWFLVRLSAGGDSCSCDVWRDSRE